MTNDTEKKGCWNHDRLNGTNVASQTMRVTNCKAVTERERLSFSARPRSPRASRPIPFFPSARLALIHFIDDTRTPSLYLPPISQQFLVPLDLRLPQPDSAFLLSPNLAYNCPHSLDPKGSLRLHVRNGLTQNPAPQLPP